MIYESRAKLVQNRQPVEVVLSDILSDDETRSRAAGAKLVSDAKRYGVSMRDYLTLRIDTRKGENANPELSGYEAALSYLNLPVRDSLSEGIVLEAAADTFHTYPGTRALFPEVVDDVVRWNYRQDQIERVDALVGNSRTISGNELISTVVTDSQDDYTFTQPIAELGRVPMRSLRTTQSSVQIWKHGSGIEMSYEFSRRASLDVFTPYANRIQREIEISKVGVATHLLVNGDSVHGAAPVVTQSSLDSTATKGKLSYEAILTWLVKRAQAGTPVDTVVGNWDAYIEWLKLFAVPDIGTGGRTAAESLAQAGVGLHTRLPLLNMNVGFVISSSAPATKLIGFSIGDTLEELKEAGSQIEESERSIQNQAIHFIKTENTGYRLVFGDTRSILNFGD